MNNRSADVTRKSPSFRPLVKASLLAALTMVTLTTAVYAGPPPWPNAPFTYYAEKKPLGTVLKEFASAYNLRLQSQVAMRDSVSGRFNFDNPTEFLNRLSGTFGFTWFTHSGVLHIADNQDAVTKSIPTPAVRSGGNLRQLMINLGVYEPRFGWGEMPELGVVMVSGPAAYVQLIERTLQSLPNAPGGQQIAVYRLKHASVEDRTINYRDQNIVVPGVTSILRGLVRTSTAGAGATSTLSSRTSPSPSLRAGDTSSGAVAAPTGGSQAETSALPVAAATTSAGSLSSPGNINAAVGGVRPSIQSDPRINAVIVQDTPERLPLYKELIQQLDVPAPLVEIEALIIDVNTNRLTELGLSWNVVGDRQRIALGFGDVSGPVDSRTLSIAGSRAGGVTPGTLTATGADYFVSRLRLLEQQGDASIQSRPSILTTENLGAVIDLSETFYIQTTSERSTLVTPVTAGLTLRVTPRIVQQESQQYSIRLTVDIEDGQIQTQNTIGSIPTVVRGVVSTEASVGPNESLLLGGYNSVQSVKGRDKVPLLGDIPGLGALFTTTSDKVQRRERLFLIRSNVVGRPAQITVQGSVPPVDASQAGVQNSATGTSFAPVDPTFRSSPVAASIRAAALNAPSTVQRGTAPSDAVAIDPAAQQMRDRRAQQIAREELQRSKNLLDQLVRTMPSEPQLAQEREKEILRVESDVQALERELSKFSQR